MNNILNKLNVKGSTFIRNQKPYGFIYGKWYIGYITDDSSNGGRRGGNKQTLYLVIKRKVYNDMKKESKIVIDKESGKVIPSKIITFIEDFSSSCYWRDYRKREYNATKYLKKEPKPYQKEIIDNMIDIVSNKDSRAGTFFLFGEPGTGKSITTLFLAKKINAYHCKCYDPTDPGTRLSMIYSFCSPDEEKPLIIVIEECDHIIKSFMKGDGIPRHKECPIEVRKKGDWNMLLDDIELGLYPNMYVILTSNRSLEEINDIDSSLLRDGRKDKAFHVSKKFLKLE